MSTDVSLEMVREVSRGSAKRRRLGAAILSGRGQIFWLLIDWFLCFVGAITGSWMSPYEAWGNFSPEILVTAGIFATSFALGGVGTGIFERKNRFRPSKFLAGSLVSWAIALAVTILLVYAALFWTIGRYAPFFGSLMGLAVVLVMHGGVAVLARRLPYRVLFLGAPTGLSDQIGTAFESRNVSLRNVGYWSDLESKIQNVPHDTVQEKVAVLLRLDISEIVLTDRAAEEPQLTDLALLAMKEGIRVVDEFSAYVELLERVPVDKIKTDWLLREGVSLPGGPQYLVKRLTDYSLSFVLLLVLSPFILLTALLIKLTSRGPAFFVQQRQGQFCQPFNVIKFRTMRWRKEGKDPPSTRHRDPRITWMGRLLRPFHLDEVPQLINIVRGEMSFVGPRPEDLRFVESIRQTVPVYEFRHVMPPGITGLSQVNVGYTLDNESDTMVKLSHDFFYILNYGILMDIRIVIRTLFVLARNVH